VAFNPQHQERESTPSFKPIDISAPTKVGTTPLSSSATLNMEADKRCGLAYSDENLADAWP
jgi:hypothetical protein